ncbi:MAG: hypothetical protein HYY50_00475 [Candidatus Kerfeldbacteria bacterium]|nr:hypothetical protein [Candidatus Kerfeldbacteria bacterium]
MKKWVCDFAPRRVRVSALRHGLRPAPEDELLRLGIVPPIRPTSEPGRWADWSMYPGQPELRCINGFDPEEYRSMLYDADGNPLPDGQTAKDFEANAADLHRLIRWVMSQPTRR